MTPSRDLSEFQERATRWLALHKMYGTVRPESDDPGMNPMPMSIPWEAYAESLAALLREVSSAAEEGEMAAIEWCEAEIAWQSRLLAVPRNHPSRDNVEADHRHRYERVKAARERYMAIRADGGGRGEGP